MQHRRSIAPPWPGLVAILVASFLGPAVAHARSRGIPSVGCNGCHGAHNNSSLSLSPLVAEAGTQTTLRFTLSDPDARVAGLYTTVDDGSAFAIPDGQQLALVGQGIAHTSPREFVDGQIVYEVTWDVPVTPGASRFVVSTLAADGNGRNNGEDEDLTEYVDVVYGCEPHTFYQDLDGDGFGRIDLPRVFCAGPAPLGYGASGDDCNDNDAGIHPTAEEYCNRRDDNCDGVVDEGALPVELFPDADGDGFSSHEEWTSGDVVFGCVPYPGYADWPGDCQPDNPNAHPDAVEICDGYIDEDCDGRIDERVRPICGIGWCRQESPTCNIEDCIPGEPSEEVCNFADDDCDDEVDEGILCPQGEECLAGMCRPAEIESTGTGAGGTTDPGMGPAEAAGGGEGSESAAQEKGASCQMGCRPRGASLLLLLAMALAVLSGRRRRQGVLTESRD